MFDQQFTGAQASLILLHAHLDLFKHLSDWGVDRRCRLGAVFVFLIVATLALLQSRDGRLFILMVGVGKKADFNMLGGPISKCFRLELTSFLVMPFSSFAMSLNCPDSFGWSVWSNHHNWSLAEAPGPIHSAVRQWVWGW